MKNEVIPIPVDAEIRSLVRSGSKSTGFKLADVMRQGLRHGVPAFIQRLQIAGARSTPKCLDYLADYPDSPVPAKGYKPALRAKLLKKHACANR